jgi:uncharacterized DUF497 family protein
METRFEWDPAKAKRNLRLHGVSFETAIEVFPDPLRPEPVGHRQNQITGFACGRLRGSQPAGHRDHPLHFRKKGRKV